MKSFAAHLGYAAVALFSPTVAHAASLPIPDGVYVTKPQFCEDLRMGELEMIDFEVSKGGAAFGYPESACVVAEVTVVREGRYSVIGDCNEFGEIWQSSFFLDVLGDQEISIDGQPHQLCSGGPSEANADTLLEEWMDWNERCRGGSGDEPATLEACDRRAEISAELEGMNLCYGKENQAGAEYEWHTCGAGSIHFVE